MPVAFPAGADSATVQVSRGYVHTVKKNLPVYLRTPDRRMLGWWKQAEGYLLEFDRLCREARIPWVLNLIPEEIQVDPEVRGRVLQDLSLSADDYDCDGPQRRLQRFAAGDGILCLDVLPELRALHRPGARLYVPNDTHRNRRGNRLAGEMLADFIRRNHLVLRPVHDSE